MSDDDYRPDDTLAMRIRAKSRDDRTTRETLGNTTGVGTATLVIWVAGLVGVDMQPDAAVVIGGVLSTVFSSLFRKFLAAKVEPT